MKKLKDLVRLVENNDECVIFEIVRDSKSGWHMELIKLGCFDGDELMFRVTKRFNENGKPNKNGYNHYTFWGYNNQKEKEYCFSCRSHDRFECERHQKCMRMIDEMLIDDFGIGFWRHYDDGFKQAMI